MLKHILWLKMPEMVSVEPKRYKYPDAFIKVGNNSIKLQPL